jgi:hypothetical protein
MYYGRAKYNRLIVLILYVVLSGIILQHDKTSKENLHKFNFFVILVIKHSLKNIFYNSNMNGDIRFQFNYSIYDLAVQLVHTH